MDTLELRQEWHIPNSEIPWNSQIPAPIPNPGEFGEGTLGNAQDFPDWDQSWTGGVGICSDAQKFSTRGRNSCWEREKWDLGMEPGPFPKGIPGWNSGSQQRFLRIREQLRTGIGAGTGSGIRTIPRSFGSLGSWPLP